MRTYQFDFNSRRIGPIPLIVGGVVGIALLVGLVILVSMFAVFFLGAGLLLAAGGSIAMAVRRFLGAKKSEGAIPAGTAKISEVSEQDAGDVARIQEVEVEIVEGPDSGGR